jgi:hypothetical protein
MRRDDTHRIGEPAISRRAGALAPSCYHNLLVRNPLRALTVRIASAQSSKGWRFFGGWNTANGVQANQQRGQASSLFQTRSSTSAPSTLARFFIT